MFFYYWIIDLRCKQHIDVVSGEDGVSSLIYNDVSCYNPIICFSYCFTIAYII